MFLAKLKEELIQLKEKTHVQPRIWQEFSSRVNKGLPLTKTEKISEHLCTFFLPVHRPTKSVYLIHHIKGNDWMPPGGHIEPNELPRQTVEREYQEELSMSLGKEKVELFDLTVKPITNHPYGYCTKHFDFWYLVWVPSRYNFVWDKGEFHAAGWFDIKTGIGKIKDNPDYKQVLQSLDQKYL